MRLGLSQLRHQLAAVEREGRTMPTMAIWEFCMIT